MEIEKNKISKLIERCSKKPIDVKWTYKVKRTPNDEIAKHKARLMERDFIQKFGIDFDKVYAPVVRLETIKIIVSTAADRGWKIHQLDVNLPFLNGPLEEEVYATKKMNVCRQQVSYRSRQSSNVSWSK